MHRGRLSDLAPAQPGGRRENTKRRNPRGKEPLTAAVLVVVPTGRAVCDGTKTDLHEAQAWKLLHAGKGLLQNPLS